MSRKKSQSRHKKQSQRNNCRRQRGGDARSIDLASILPDNSFYPYNNSSLGNPIDTRAPQQQVAHTHAQRGGRARHRARTSKYINYAGRQVGCRTRARTRSGRSRTRHGRQQSGGDSLNYLPSDANMLLRSASTFAGNLWAGLKGVHGAPSALPFEDQALQSVK